MPLTPADVHNVVFKKPPIGKRGYDEDEVDAFLDVVEAELARLIEENNELRSSAGSRVQARQLLPRPQHLTWEEAACYTLTLATAYRMLYGNKPHVHNPGQNVLVWGAWGGLGVFAVLCMIVPSTAASGCADRCIRTRCPP